MTKLSYAQRFWIVSTLLLFGGFLLFLAFAPSIRDNLLHFAQLPSNSSAKAQGIEQALLKLVPYGTPKSDVEAFIIQSGGIFGTEQQAKDQGSYISCHRDEEQRIIFCNINGNPIIERLSYFLCSGSGPVDFYLDSDNNLVYLRVQEYSGGCL